MQAFSERPPYLGFVLGILECAKVFFSIVVRVQAFSERPPYLGFMVQATAVSIGGSRMIRPTGAVVCGRADGPHRPIERFSLERLSDQSAPTLVGALPINYLARSCGLAYATWIGGA